MADATAQVAKRVPEDEVRDHRQQRRREDSKGNADERARPALQGAGGRLPRRLPRGSAVAAKPVRAARHGRRRRRPEDPAGRPLHRRATTPARRRPAPKVKVAHSYSQDFVDQAKCKEQALEPDRQRRRRRLPGRGPVRPRRPVGGEGEGRVRDRRRRRPGLPRRARADERDEEGRRRGVQDDRGCAGSPARRSARTSTRSSR